MRPHPDTMRAAERGLEAQAVTAIAWRALGLRALADHLEERISYWRGRIAAERRPATCRRERTP